MRGKTGVLGRSPEAHYGGINHARARAHAGAIRLVDTRDRGILSLRYSF